jgi:hypothetical protein
MDVPSIGGWSAFVAGVVWRCGDEIVAALLYRLGAVVARRYYPEKGE